MTRFSLATLASLTLFAVACDVEPEPDTGLTVQEQEDAQLARTLSQLLQPPEVGGCGDIFVHASSIHDRHAMFLTVAGATIEDAYDGGATELTFVLPHPDVDLTVQWGRDLTIHACNDAIVGSPVVNGEAVAVEGTVHIDLELLLTTPQPWDMSSLATITMEDVVFQTANGAQRTWSVDLGSPTVGWLPG